MSDIKTTDPDSAVASNGTGPRIDQQSGTGSVAAPRQPRTLWQEVKRRLVLSAIAFAIYVISLGPMYWIYFDAKYNEGPAWIAAIYEPLYIVSEWFPPLARVIDWYLRFWIY